jgi:hypothetical protein
MNDPRIANPLKIANWLYNDQGTMGDVELDSLDIEELYHAIIDPKVGIVPELPEFPILHDVRNAVKILGAKIVGED